MTLVRGPQTRYYHLGLTVKRVITAACSVYMAAIETLESGVAVAQPGADDGVSGMIRKVACRFKRGWGPVLALHSLWKISTASMQRR